MPQTTAYPLHRQSPEAAAVLQIHHAILTGLLMSQVPEVARWLRVTPEDLALRIGLSRATFHRRMQKPRQKLSEQESDLLVRHRALYEKASSVFEDQDAAVQWLKSPQVGLGGEIPIDLARSTAGYAEVDKLLTRIDQGVYA